MVSDRSVPEFRITQSTSVTLCMMSVIKFPVPKVKKEQSSEIMYSVQFGF